MKKLKVGNADPHLVRTKKEQSWFSPFLKLEVKAEELTLKV